MMTEHRAWAREFFEEIVPEVALLQAFQTPAKAAALWDALNEKASDDLDDEGAAHAEEERRAIGISGCERWIASEKQRRAGAIFVRSDDGKGRRVKNQSFRRTRKRDKAGDVIYQQRLWEHFTYEQTVDFAEWLVSIAYGSAVRAAAFDRVRKAHEKHQELTAGEACRREGIDPSTIEVGEGDVRQAIG